MKIEFENFGQAGSGSLSLNDLTIICGPNSSGKTYTSYAVYGILKHFSDLFEFGIKEHEFRNLLEGEPIEVDLAEIKKNIAGHLNAVGSKFSGGLDSYFNAPKGFFDGAHFKFELSDDEFDYLSPHNSTARIGKNAKIEAESESDSGLLNLAYTADEDFRLPRQVLRDIVNDLVFSALFAQNIPSPFVVTSERTGVALFYKDLDYNSNAIFSHLRDSDKIDPIKIIEAMRSRYARPIQDNIDDVRDFENISKRKSFLRADKEKFKFVSEGLSNLIGGGSYKAVDGQLVFSPRKKRNQPKLSVPLYIASSSIKSLFLVDMFVNYVARENQILIIDEPELNLHPDNQVKVARLIARLVNAGVKVLVTTHSDYLVREINNLISLSSVGDAKKSLMRQHGLHEKEILLQGQVSAYCAGTNAGLQEMEVSESGINTEIFDTIISEANSKAQDIYFSIEDARED